MKNVYVDTNLVLAAFRKQDENYPLMEKIREQKHLELVTSTLTICEMYTVLMNEKNTLLKAFEEIISLADYEKFVELPIQKQLKLAIDYLLNYYNITLVEDSELDIETFRLQTIKIEAVKKILLRMDKNIHLRTLDLLHYAHAKYMTEYKDRTIHYLVTSDGVFQKSRAGLKEDSTIIILSPESLLDIEG